VIAIQSKRGGRVFVTVGYVVALLCAIAVARRLPSLHPIWVAAIADGISTLVVFVFSVLLDNSSVYDPYWSVAPILIAGYWTGGARAGTSSLRQIIILVFVFVWGVRLTANWALRWRGPADEDFRYAEIRAKTGRAYWPASFGGIHLMPTVWVFLGLVPIFPALARPGFALLDVAAALLTACAIVIETLADWQLRQFRRAAQVPGAILDAGLWALCRHPNYLGEVLFWWGLFVFGIAADLRWAWSVVGPICITLLFLFVSVPWMDRRMLSRHPAWAERMKQVPALIPWTRSRR
jgi:steroid 5-alpha reductase family enzyme